MEWPLMLLALIGSLIVLMFTGMPVAFCFMLVNVIFIYLFAGGLPGLGQLVFSINTSVATFVLVPIPTFILMGEVLFHSGIAPDLLDALDKWLGRLPGRLSLLSVAGGTLFATLTGASMASTALLGTVLMPEMDKRGYARSMSMGPIMGSGGLAVLIPPSNLAVLFGAIALVPVGEVLVSTIVPGILLAAVLAIYIVGRCWLQPSLAPAYELPKVPFFEKVRATVWHILPVGIVVFLVIGVMLLGIATPTEAAALGVVGSFTLAAIHRKLTWEMTKKASLSAVKISVMMLLIVAGATAFSQILAFTGASAGLAKFIVDLPLAPILIIIAIQFLLFFLGMFMSALAIMMITLPTLMPVVLALGFSPVWFAALFLLNMEVATISPPFGLNAFAMKGVAPKDVTLEQVYKAGFPIIACQILVLALLIAFPSISLWLPSLMD